MTSGLLLIDKPKGWTSHDVVAKVRGITGIRQIGHAGTLDPLATGLLILLVGNEATKKQAEFQKLEKTYDAVITLGATSATDDSEGPITPTEHPSAPTPEALEHGLDAFRGSFEQLPPAVSAKQVKGQRAYRAARKGKPLSIEPVRITVFELTLLDYRYPNVHLRIRCSSGTYIRSIARDLGQKLGTGGYLSGLRRTAIGPFQVRYGVPIERLNSENWKMLLGDHLRTSSEYNQRAVGIVVKDDTILVIFRSRVGRGEYYVFPGGGVRPDEKPEAAVIRELKEELNLEARQPQLLLTLNNDGREEQYFLIEDFSGHPEMSGEEHKRMHADNQYIPRWIPLSELSRLTNLFPVEAQRTLSRMLKNKL